ncbi:hypothetical protein SAMN06273570_1823 [Candidatus Pantoea floridensis]|uniref:Uncharacterized protein n=1 Tax=Candidatus Pantoea floridensis TaxID=1938870 RepID=A0A286BTJ0_9GAMM|nr:hypothetical protein BX596_3501 [Enterobacteriaceae bacterium JKS000233]SOD37469.1 hypothetical protein SAMN06273570_1823 [Pantoea floridensis]
MPFAFVMKLNEKAAIEHFGIKAFIRWGMVSKLTFIPEIIRKVLLHLTINSHFIIT